MNKIRHLFKPADNSGVRVALCMSGTGSNADVLLRSAREADSGFEIAVLFTDQPEKSSAAALAEKYNVPCEFLDINEFYRERGENDIKLDSPRRQEIRAEWSGKVWEKLAPYQCGFAVFAGFVPLNDLPDRLPCLNVHPGDLTVEKDGVRVYAGLHFLPVEKAILNGEKSLRSSVICVPGFSRSKVVDGGPVLGISAPVDVEFNGATLEELREIKAQRKTSPYQDKLREAAKASVEKLKVAGDHVVLPQVVKMFAAGKYGIDDKGSLYLLDDSGKWQKIKTVEFSANSIVVQAEKMKNKASRNKFVRFCKYMYTKIVRGNGSPDYIARGWALGMFVGCVVPVFCQLIVAVPLSFVFRCSKIGAALGTFITTPPTAIFIYPVLIWVGNKVINGNLSSDAAKTLLDIFNNPELSFADKWQAFADLGGSLVAAFFAGGLLWAAVMTPLTYFGVRYLVVRYRKMREELFKSKRMKKENI